MKGGSFYYLQRLVVDAILRALKMGLYSKDTELCRFLPLKRQTISTLFAHLIEQLPKLKGINSYDLGWLYHPYLF